jgi:hypothetical protein
MEPQKLFQLLEQLERMNGLCNHVEGKPAVLSRLKNVRNAGLSREEKENRFRFFVGVESMDRPVPGCLDERFGECVG